jgi:uncharacterized membrane protein
MKKIESADIQIICNHSDISEQGIAEILGKHIYNDAKAWHKFLRLLFITLGVGFTVLGIVFFFAYNWADLHKFAKLGIMEALVLIVTCLAVIPKFSTIIRNIILTGATVVVGTLFAVFGQIYQTGANAYDFFLGWTVFVTLWVVVSNFAPLWLLYVALLNTTLILYEEQVVRDWSFTFLCILLFSLCTLVAVASVTISRYKGLYRIPDWFTKTIGLASVSYGTLGIILGIFSQYESTLIALIGIVTAGYSVGIWHGFRTKSLFYLSVIACSAIAIVIALFINNISFDGQDLLWVSMFSVAAVTVTVKALISLKKKWESEVGADGIQ